MNIHSFSDIRESVCMYYIYVCYSSKCKSLKLVDNEL